MGGWEGGMYISGFKVHRVYKGCTCWVLGLKKSLRLQMK